MWGPREQDPRARRWGGEASVPGGVGVCVGVVAPERRLGQQMGLRVRATCHPRVGTEELALLRERPRAGGKDLAPEPRGRRARREDERVPAGLRVRPLPAAPRSVAAGCWVLQGPTLALPLVCVAILGQRPGPSEDVSWLVKSSSCVSFVISVRFLGVILPL